MCCLGHFCVETFIICGHRIKSVLEDLIIRKKKKNTPPCFIRKLWLCSISSTVIAMRFLQRLAVLVLTEYPSAEGCLSRNSATALERKTKFVPAQWASGTGERNLLIVQARSLPVKQRNWGPSAFYEHRVHMAFEFCHWRWFCSKVKCTTL